MITTALQNGRYGGVYPNLESVPANRIVVSEPYNFNLILGVWNGSEWVEGASQEDLDLKKEEYLYKLVQVVNELDKKLLISSVNKEENDIDYLKNQSARYLDKYRVAKKYCEFIPTVLNPIFIPITSDEDWYNQIVDELSETNRIQGVNISLSDFMQLIVDYYELGEYRNKRFQIALEIFRAKTKDFILTFNWQKADECISMASSIPNQMDLNDLDDLLTQFNAV